MALPSLPPCRDYSVTESGLSGCLSAWRPHMHGLFRRCRIRSRCARFDERSSIKPSVLAALGGIDAASPHGTILILMGLKRGRGQRKKQRPLKKSTTSVITVSKMRVELTRPIGHYPLKVARLPIPPPGQIESERRDSDPRPRPWQGRALPTELLSHSKYCFQYRTIVKFKERERKTGLGPATPTLARSCSTN